MRRTRPAVSKLGSSLPSDQLDGCGAVAQTQSGLAHFFGGDGLGPMVPSYCTRLPGGRRLSWLAMTGPADGERAIYISPMLLLDLAWRRVSIPAVARWLLD